ncbi:hypothetical protein J6590_027581 [Homalodisca vitripennis]|nr:hypothetical protein J6590_027581 [Homalodisca vitripennis]
MELLMCKYFKAGVNEAWTHGERCRIQTTLLRRRLSLNLFRRTWFQTPGVKSETAERSQVRSQVVWYDSVRYQTQWRGHQAYERTSYAVDSTVGQRQLLSPKPATITAEITEIKEFKRATPKSIPWLYLTRS